MICRRLCLVFLIIFHSVEVLTEDSYLAEGVDPKTTVMTVLGIRKAWASGERQIKLEIGASTSAVNQNPRSYRIISHDDSDYSYWNFVTPAKASATTFKEFEVPPGFEIGKGRFSGPFTRTEVLLELPFPLKKGKSYSVVGIGLDGKMVTAARTAATFTYGASDTVALPVRQVMGMRRISSIGNGILKVEFGPAFSVKNGVIPQNYKVTINNVPHPVKKIGRRSKIDVYQPVRWPFEGILEHHIFLDCGNILRDNDEVKIKVADGVTTGSDSAGLQFNKLTSFSPSIKVNQIGYQTNSPIKRAMLGCWLGSFPEKSTAVSELNAESFFDSDQSNDNAQVMAPYALSFEYPPEFKIYSASTLVEVYRGKSRFIHNGLENDGRVNHSGENVYELDFTEFKVPGRYFIAISGVGRSFEFEIADDVYRKAFEKQAYGVFVQRSGIELRPPFSEWRRVASLNKGITVTTERRFEHDKWGKFKENMVMMRNPDISLNDSFEKLVSSKDAVAGFTFNGNLSNAVKNGPEAEPIAASFRFEKDNILCADGMVLESNPDGKNGFKLKTGIDFRDGAAASFWFRKNPTTGSRYDGVLLAFGDSKISVNWGLFYFMLGRQRVGWQRIRDNDWHHFLINIFAGANGEWQTVFYVDGVQTAEFKHRKKPSDQLVFANIGNINCGGAYFGRLMVFKRSLNERERVLVAEKIPEKIPFKLQASGGHHDAGDYNPRSRIEVAQVLMNAYEMTPQKFYDGQLNIPEKNNGIPDIVDEALWALKLWRGLQDPKDGGVYNGTESQGDPNFIQTVELDDTGDYAWAKDSQGSFKFAGAMAQAYRILKKHGKSDEAADYLQRAVSAYEWGCRNPVPVGDLKIYGEFYLAPKAYAAAELLNSTGDAKYNADFIESSPWSRNPDAEISIYGKYDFTLAACSYAAVPDHLTDKDIKKSVVAAICREADMYIKGSSKMAYKFIRHPYAPIGWGNGAYSQFLTIVRHAWWLTGNDEYYKWIVLSCDNTLGCNPLNLSWVVGLGTRTIRAPLHNSRYNPTGMPVDGQHAEGPYAKGKAYNYLETVYPPHSDRFAVMHAFIDSHFAIAMDEGMVSRQAETLAAFGALLPDR